MITRNPEAVYFLIKNVVKGWSKKWKNMVEKILPTPEQFQQEQFAIAVRAVAMYMESIARARMKAEKVGGDPPPIDPQELMAIITQFKKEAVTPPSEKELKEREKQAKQSGEAEKAEMEKRGIASE